MAEYSANNEYSARKRIFFLKRKSSFSSEYFRTNNLTNVRTKGTYEKRVRLATACSFFHCLVWYLVNSEWHGHRTTYRAAARWGSWRGGWWTWCAPSTPTSGSTSATSTTGRCTTTADTERGRRQWTRGAMIPALESDFQLFGDSGSGWRSSKK